VAVRKAAKTGTTRGITSGAKDPLNKLPIHKRNFVLARVGGATVAQSAAHAGVSKRQGAKYNTQADIQAAYRSLMQKAISAKKLINLIKGGCEAKAPVYSPDGKKVGERADWKTRRGYIEMAAKHTGYYEDKNSGTPVGIQVVVQHIGQKNGNSERTTEITAQTVGTSQLM
jgi:hypothetical protein